ncbi:S8 family peptidase [Paenibacillus terrae]|uniref:S8 family peptidase n=1 Tax=Paenibacillus terrae TaxID=159743 RepID=UPI0011EA7850|nr:S8 family peptidase [Paenibacillus terrae]
MERKMKLIPYKTEQTVSDVYEIPAGVKIIQALEAWEKGRKGNGVLIAVLDTGCDKEHPDLKGRIHQKSRNFSNEGEENDITDILGHGTHVAGTIAAIENGRGVVGVAPEADLLILKVFDDNGLATNENLIRAIDYAILQKARVISMSLGSPFDDPNLHEAVKRATQAEIAVVCAAGNEGDNRGNTVEKSFPAAYPESICVGAINQNKHMAIFSNTNDQVDLVAPGVEILSTWNGGNYQIISGTSMAAPHVSGAIALLINQYEHEFNRRLTEGEIYAQLVKRTVSLGLQKDEEGNGLLLLSERIYNNEAKAFVENRELINTH